MTLGVAAYPSATLAVHCGNGFDAGFEPYQSTRLADTMLCLLDLGAAYETARFHYTCRRWGSCVAARGARAVTAQGWTLIA
jgi:hypothetical protein